MKETITRKQQPPPTEPGWYYARSKPAWMSDTFLVYVDFYLKAPAPTTKGKKRTNFQLRVFRYNYRLEDDHLPPIIETGTLKQYEWFGPVPECIEQEED